MYSTQVEKTIGTLISLVKGETKDVIESIGCQVLEEESSFNWWCSHPERISAYGRVRQIAGGIMIAGIVYYKNQHERIRVIIRDGNYENREVKRSALIDGRGDEMP